VGLDLLLEAVSSEISSCLTLETTYSPIHSLRWLQGFSACVIVSLISSGSSELEASNV
jgi:hypothetical protein